MFEGNYSNGNRWDEKGYDDKNNVIYELKNGTGYIKIYNYYRDLIFEGEYWNGERNGKGKDFDFSGKLEYEGEIRKEKGME